MTVLNIARFGGHRMVNDLNYSHIQDDRSRLEVEVEKVQLIEHERMRGVVLPEEFVPRIYDALAQENYTLCREIAHEAREYLAQSTLPMDVVLRTEMDRSLSAIIGAARNITHDAKYPPKSSR